MSKALHHDGLTIEPDLKHQELRIEGVKIDIVKEGNLFVLKNHPDIRAQTLYDLGIKIIDSWREIKDNREDIKEEHLNILLQKGVKYWNQWRRKNPAIRPILYKADLGGNDFMSGEPVDFSNANLIGANLSKAILNGANFHEANLAHADLSYARLKGAHFCRTDLYCTNLSHAILDRANLQGTQMAMTDLRKAKLRECKIYGMSAWDLKLKGAIQRDLTIVYTREFKKGEWEESSITVDNLETGQFVYLLLDNPKIRDAINTITRKVVLILGRFADKERKAVLNELRGALRKKDLVPVVFDFGQPKNRNMTETIQLLADMARFVIADITDAKSVPHELSHIVPVFPSVPVMPMLLKGEESYSMFNDWKDKTLPIFYYENKTHLIANIENIILKQVEDWENKYDTQLKMSQLNEKKDTIINELQKTNDALQKQIQTLISKNQHF